VDHQRCLRSCLDNSSSYTEHNELSIVELSLPHMINAAKKYGYTASFMKLIIASNHIKITVNYSIVGQTNDKKGCVSLCNVHNYCGKNWYYQ